MSRLGENFRVAVGKICATAIAVPVEKMVIALKDERSIWDHGRVSFALREGGALISATQ